MNALDLGVVLHFVLSHNMPETDVDGDDIIFGVPLTLNGELMPFFQWERVSTMKEARNALGY